MNIRAFAVVLVLALLAGGGFWLLQVQEVDAPGAAAEATATSEPAAAGSMSAETKLPTLAEGAAGSTERTLVPAAVAAPTRGFTGRVVDELGNPMAKAAVTCAPAQDFGGGRGREFADFDPRRFAERMRVAQQDVATTETDADGRFTVAAPGEARNLDLRVRARKFAALDRNQVRPTAIVDLGELRLRPAALVAGRVVGRDGAGLPGALVGRGDGAGPFGDLLLDFGAADFVDAMPWQTDTARTDAEGRFELAHFPAGEFALTARHPDHPAGRVEGLSVAARGELRDVLITLEPGAAIRGKVVQRPAAATALQVMASRVRPAEPQGEAEGQRGFALRMGQVAGEFGIGERTAEVAPDGTFALRGLAVGATYQVWGVQVGRGFAGTSPCTARLDVPSGAEGVELRYEAGVTVTMQVVDAASSAPVERLWVSDRIAGGEGFDLRAFLPTGSGDVRTFPDGKVVLANLRPKAKQTLRLTIDAAGYQRFTREGIELPVAGELDLGVVRLASGPVVRVTVTDPDGAPLAGAQVRARVQRAADNGVPFDLGALRMGGGRGEGGGGPDSMRTDAAGFAVVNAAVSAPVTVNVEAAGFAPFESAALTVPGNGTDLAVRLLLGGTLAVTVVDADGKPLGNVDVERSGPGGGGNRRTDAAGLAKFVHLAPGKHRVRLGRNRLNLGNNMAVSLGLGGRGDESGWQDVEVADRAVAEARLVRETAVTLSGLVLENGVPLQGAQVRFVPGTDDASAASGVEGMIEQAMRGGGRGRRGGGDGRTDAAGRYELDNLQPGEHRLRVTHANRALATTVRVALRPGPNAFDIGLRANVVRGVVRDKAGKPFAGAAVSVANNSAADPLAALARMGGRGRGGGGAPRNETDAEGRYELRGLPTGVPLRVRAQAKGFGEGLSALITLGDEGARENVDLELIVGGAIEVTMANASPFAAAMATLEGETGASPVTQVLRNGRATLEGLRPGTWRVSLVGTTTAEPQVVQVTEGSKVSVSF